MADQTLLIDLPDAGMPSKSYFPNFRFRFQEAVAISVDGSEASIFKIKWDLNSN